MQKLVVLIVFIFAVSVQYGQTTLTEAIDFSATDVEGNEWNLFQILDAGQYVCLDFSKADCILSQENVATVNEAFNYFGCNDFDVVILGINTGNTVAEVQFFIQEFGVGIPYISGINGAEILTIYEDYLIAACPTQILIAPDHTIVEQDIWSYAGETVLIPVLESHGLKQNSCFVGIHEKQDVAINLFPNPADGFIEIQLNTRNNFGDTKIEIFNLLGQKQKSINLVSDRIKIDISDFDEGMYLLSVSSDVEQLQTERFIVLR
jgi:hypothetical protein